MCVYVYRYIADPILYMYQCLMCAYYIRYCFVVASFPGPAQFSVASIFRLRAGRAWERG